MRAVVIVPTYNEAENIERFLRDLRVAAPNTDIMVVDDNSPDGTAGKAKTIADELGAIKVVSRSGKRGYAAASREGMQLALTAGYEVVATMDADFSHDPNMLERLTARIDEKTGLVIGSRYVEAGSVTNWPLFRRALSHWGNRYTAFCLRLKIEDCTSGFRAYSAQSLSHINLPALTADGYAFLTEMVFVISRNNLGAIVETPINFVDRAYGTSKMNLRIMRESMLLVTRWGLALRLGIGRKHLPC